MSVFSLALNWPFPQVEPTNPYLKRNAFLWQDCSNVGQVIDLQLE
jgi:hypothetical protein